MMTDKKVTVQFTVLTFCIAYLVSGALIVFGQFGYSVYNWVQTLQQFAMNIPFAIYILSPAIASYIVLKKNNKIASIKEWLKTVFYVKNKIALYLYVTGGLALYFLIHIAVSGSAEMALPFYTFFLSLPGSLIIGGLEEAGWMYILQPELDKKIAKSFFLRAYPHNEEMHLDFKPRRAEPTHGRFYSFVLSSLFTGIIWTLWHIPLFFIPGTNHGEGFINFWMFTIQLFAFRFFNGAIYKISGKGRVFMCVLFHTMFNAASPVFGTLTMTWAGTAAANAAIVFVSILTVVIYEKKHRRIGPA